MVSPCRRDMSPDRVSPCRSEKWCLQSRRHKNTKSRDFVCGIACRASLSPACLQTSRFATRRVAAMSRNGNENFIYFRDTAGDTGLWPNKTLPYFIQSAYNLIYSWSANRALSSGINLNIFRIFKKFFHFSPNSLKNSPWNSTQLSWRSYPRMFWPIFLINF